MKKLLLVLILLASFGFGWELNRVLKPPAPQAQPLSTARPSIYELYDDVNKIRPLLLDPELNASAATKCADMVKKDYWSHNAPDGTEPWVFFPDRASMGENLAKGFSESADIVEGWVNSPTHYKNLINPKFHRVGYAVCDFRGSNLVVQHLTE